LRLVEQPGDTIDKLLGAFQGGRRSVVGDHRVWAGLIVPTSLSAYALAKKPVRDLSMAGSALASLANSLRTPLCGVATLPVRLKMSACAE
jgi:hypothetical protein